MLTSTRGRPGDAGASVLQVIGITVVSALLVGGTLAAISEGRVVETAGYAMCRVLGGDCVDPHEPLGQATEQRCSVPPSGPAGAPRISYQVDLGSGAPVSVDEFSGGGFTVTVPGSLAAASEGTRTSSIYWASTDAELGSTLMGLRRQQRQASLFGSGGNPLADAWQATGSFLFDVSGEPAAPIPSGRFSATGPAGAASTNAYELASTLAMGGAVPLGTSSMTAGATTEHLAGLPQGADAPVLVQVDRDPGGFVTAVRVSTGGSGSDAVVRSLPVKSASDAAAAEALLQSLGVTTPRSYAYPVVTSGDSATTPASALSAFSDAADRSGFVARSPGGTAVASGGPIAVGDLGRAMRDARKTTPAGQRWDGRSWTPWQGCQ